MIRLLSLRQDQADVESIEAAVRDGSRLAGTNVWVVMLAIVVASVGLNVNSTAVIIGAMLISPLMGPIVAIGYGAAVNDQALLRQSFANLAVFVAVSVAASTAYFAASPLTFAQSELLARTSPSIWDVLIAFFGGAAGMIALTRREKTNLVPGVAIATALMPPLCTAGYGLATWQPAFFAGAFYLFLINGVFIALATLVVARILRLPQHVQPDGVAKWRGRAVITAAVLATALPSVYLAYRLVEDEVFKHSAERFLRQVEQSTPDLTLLASEVDPKQRSIAIAVVGPGVSNTLAKDLESRLAAQGLAGTTLTVRDASEPQPDVGLLKREVQRDVQRSTVTAIEANAARIARLEQEVRAQKANALDLSTAPQEIQALLPGVRKVVVTQAPAPADAAMPRQQILVAIDSARALRKADQALLERWMHARWPTADVQLVVGRMNP